MDQPTAGDPPKKDQASSDLPPAAGNTPVAVLSPPAGPTTGAVTPETPKEIPNEAPKTAPPVSDPAEMQSLLNSLLTNPADGATTGSGPLPETPLPETVVVPPQDNSGKKSGKKGGSKAAVIVMMMILLITIPVGVYYYFQQRQNVYEESQATGICLPAYECSEDGLSCGDCTSFPVLTPSSDGYACCQAESVPGVYPSNTPVTTVKPTFPPVVDNAYRPCPDGYDAVVGGSCYGGTKDEWDKSDPLNMTCYNEGTPIAHFVCPGTEFTDQGCGYNTPGSEKIYDGPGPRSFINQKCGMEQIDTVGGWMSIKYCVPCEDEPPPPGPSKTPTQTPIISPTPTPAQCLSLKCYDENDVQVNPGTLRPGDKVTFGVLAGPATKARFRINGSPFDETARVRGTGAAKEFVYPEEGYYVIDQLTEDMQYKVEAEIYVDGLWK